MLKMILQGGGMFWVRDVRTNDFEREMVDTFNTLEEDDRKHIDAIYIVKLHYDVSDKFYQTICAASFDAGKNHNDVWTDVIMISANMIGFDPDKHVFICHKCNGKLAGNVEHEWCGCMSGWIRPYQRYIEVSALKAK